MLLERSIAGVLPAEVASFSAVFRERNRRIDPSSPAEDGVRRQFKETREYYPA